MLRLILVVGLLTFLSFGHVDGKTFCFVYHFGLYSSPASPIDEYRKLIKSTVINRFTSKIDDNRRSEELYRLSLILIDFERMRKVSAFIQGLQNVRIYNWFIDINRLIFIDYIDYID